MNWRVRKMIDFACDVLVNCANDGHEIMEDVINMCEIRG